MLQQKTDYYYRHYSYDKLQIDITISCIHTMTAGHGKKILI